MPPFALVVTLTAEPTAEPLPTGQPAAVTSAGVQMKNETVPEAGPSLPDSVAVSLTVPPKSAVAVDDWVASVGGTHVLKSPVATSLSVESTACDERVSARKLLKHGALPPKRLSRSMPPSKKELAGIRLFVPAWPRCCSARPPAAVQTRP